MAGKQQTPPLSPARRAASYPPNQSMPSFGLSTVPQKSPPEKFPPPKHVGYSPSFAPPAKPVTEGQACIGAAVRSPVTKVMSPTTPASCAAGGDVASADVDMSAVAATPYVSIITAPAKCAAGTKVSSVVSSEVYVEKNVKPTEPAVCAASEGNARTRSHAPSRVSTSQDALNVPPTVLADPKPDGE